MSGPKCASYWTDQAMVAEARRRAAARAERESLEARLEELQLVGEARRGHGLSEVFHLEIAKGPASDATEDIETWNSLALEAVAGAEESLAGAEQNERQQDIRAKISSVAASDTAQAILRRAEAEAVRGRTARRARAERPRAERTAERAGAGTDREPAIAALIGALPAGISAQERDSLEQQILGLAGASHAEFGSRLVAAKAEMQRVERATAERAQSRRRARELLATLHGLDGAEVDACRALLHRTIAGETPLLSTDAAAVAQARTAAEADYERRFVASRIEAAFRESGLDVRPGFATEVLSGEEAYVAARASEKHAVGVRVRDGLIDLRLVRAEGAPDARLDADAEVEFCKDFGRVSAHLHDEGVGLELVSHQRPGAVAVDVVPQARQALTARRRRRSEPSARARLR